jgi:hypothetical protein
MAGARLQKTGPGQAMFYEDIGPERRRSRAEIEFRKARLANEIP